MSVYDLSAERLEKLIRRLGATADAYKEAGLYPPPQIISELRRAQQLYEQKKIPPKPNVEKQYNLTAGCMDEFSSHYVDYMDQEITSEMFIEKTESLRNALKEMQNKVNELVEWEAKYKGTKMSF